MSSRNSVAEAFSVTGNRISSVGTNVLIRKLIGPSTRVIDARGRLVIPGFNDAHVHFMGIGNTFSTIDLRDAKTQSEVAARIARYVKFLPPGRWVLGGGLSPTVHLDKSAIDRITEENPVFIYQADSQGAFANSRASALSGLKSEPGITGNERGTTSGIVRDDALRKIARVVPPDHTRNWLEIAETATSYSASLGVTSVQDMHSDDSREIYRELKRQGKLRTRVYDCISLPAWKNLVPRAAISDNAMVRGGCVKSFSDGDEEASAELLKSVIAADKAGLQVMIHAIGNSANSIVLNVFERAAKTNGQRDRRFRIEHAHNPRSDDLVRFGESNVIASMQPFLFNGGSGGYYSSLLKLKTSIAFGSDAAITDMNPLFGIHAAVNAGTESISVYEAVRAYTVGSAYAEFQEREKGMIERGQLADFVILSDDIFTIEAGTINKATVIMTVADGRTVYQSN
ncbi:MAG TPA: amidohydrolase [Pyrinomonadaceae bacterium]